MPVEYNLRLRLSDLPRSGVTINTTLSLSALNSRLSEGSGNDIEFLAPPPRVDLTVRLERDSVESGATVKGNVVARYSQPCPRCLEVLEREITEDIDWILKPKSDEGASSWEEADDVGLVYYTGEQIDLEELVQESLILAVSPFGFEHEGCPGIQSFTVEQAGRAATLGDLFAAAAGRSGKK